MAENVQNLEQGILAGRGEVDSVRVTGSPVFNVWLFGCLSHNHMSDCESFLCRKLFPIMPEKLHKLTLLMMMRTSWTPAPHIDCMAKKNHLASGRIRTMQVKLVKHIPYIAEWKRRRVLVVEQVIDSSITVTMGKH